jgi:NADPH2:quinone reductase
MAIDRKLQHTKPWLFCPGLESIIPPMKSYQCLKASNISGLPDDFASLSCEWLPQMLPELKNDDVQIEVHYSSLNFKDALAVTGRGKILRQLPLVPGIDASGVVLKSRSDQFREGDEVIVTGCGIGETKDGGLGQVITVPATWVIRKPASLTLETAAILGTAGFTAALAIHQLEKNDLKPDALPVLVTGATGGVGSLSLLMLKQKGYKVTAWSRKALANQDPTRKALSREDDTKNDNLHERLKTWGADDVQAPPTAPTRPLESAKWSAAIDNVGGTVLAQLLSQIKPHGSVASIGLAQSAELVTTVFPFILRGVNILGTSSATCPRPLRETVWKNINSLKCDWSAVKTVDLGRSQVVDHCQKMLRGETIGRSLVHMQKEVM